MPLKIRTYGDKILRQKAETISEISPETLSLIEKMKISMDRANGVGLAAPQIGFSIRLIIVLFGLEENLPELKALINPEIIHHNDVKNNAEEGCLSVPGITEDVERWTEVTVKAISEQGEKMEFTAKNLTARIIQHEIDHLDGILFIDHLSPLKRDIIKRRLKKQQKKETVSE
ncbi:peptide deformylase [bacterium]|nr:peptide deformylase [candidate division CSSED10-310 bacterium]